MGIEFNQGPSAEVLQPGKSDPQPSAQETGTQLESRNENQ